MPNFVRRSIFNLLSLASVMLPFALLQSNVAIAQTGQSKSPSDDSTVTFSVPGDSADAPVQIAGIFIGDQQIKPGMPVHLSGSWIGKIRILVKNNSPKEVIAGTVNLIFPETGDGTPDRPLLTSGTNIGRIPALAFRKKDGTNRPIPDAFRRNPEAHFSSGSIMQFAIEPTQAATDQREAYRMAGSINAVSIHLVNFYFSDGTKWTGNSYFAPVNPPELWKSITPEEFFGRKMQVNP